MSWTQRIQHPKDVLKVGDGVRVVVLSLDIPKRKFSLSLKALGEDPWNGVTERYQPDAIVSGAVTRIADFGAFVQLEDGVEGLVHISQLSDAHVRTVADVINVSDVIQVKVLSVDAGERRISLSLKAVGRAQGEPESPSEGVAPPPKKERKRPLRGGLSW